MLKKLIKLLKNTLFKKRLEQQRRQNKLQQERCKPWFSVKGDQTLRLDYPLNENSVVFDLGGYIGEFASSIYNKYGSGIYIFEPVKRFYDSIEQKFKSNTKIKAYNYGLAGSDQTLNISMTDDASSVFIKAKNSETIQLKSIVQFINDNKIEHIDLMKINIEGGEYEVMEALIAHNMLGLFKDIQVQFHDFIIPDAKIRMKSIQNELAKTHKLTYQYEFVWENWTLKDK
ncbi:FkbM family methyltransferase [Lacinutrix sp. Hel_I_90]|uniref:FkbM family methyltransferase n=1 Tax=Lacinutrix sp. Hel_I_90 TaxID=1249999 RepID=UPI0005C970A2|nr:FkbM family methyltransferase [Lacinutrix sp. Hel_I_90]